MRFITSIRHEPSPLMWTQLLRIPVVDKKLTICSLLVSLYILNRDGRILISHVAIPVLDTFLLFTFILSRLCLFLRFWNSLVALSPMKNYEL